MSSVLGISTVILVFGVLTLIIGFILESDLVKIIGAFFSISTLLFGFLLCGSIIPVKEETKWMGWGEISKTKKSVMIEFKNDRLIFDKMEDYNSINDTTKFYKTCYYNSYDNELRISYSYK